MYQPSHLSHKFHSLVMKYAKPRPIDPQRPENAEEIVAERLSEELGEGDHKTEENSVVSGFF